MKKNRFLALALSLLMALALPLGAFAGRPGDGGA